MSAQKFYHGTYDPASIKSILSSGLSTGSSVSDISGQASCYPIILEYGHIAAEPVYYRPGDYKTLAAARDPTAIYVIVGDYGRGVRHVDDINKDLADRLADLESQGLSPEEVGGMSRRELYRVDAPTARLLDEADAFMDHGESEGGEDVLKRVKEAAVGVPVFRVSRDDEGNVDWGHRVPA